jgi:hypothetical protein
MQTILKRSSPPRLASAGLGDALAVWALYACVSVEIFVTQSRLPAADLYQPVSSGVPEGGYAVLSFAGFAGAFVGLAVLPIILDRVRARGRG